MSNFWQDLPKPFLVLAPMEDVTDFAFRELIALHLPKPHVFFTEFTSADALCSSSEFEKLLRMGPAELFSQNAARVQARHPQGDPGFGSPSSPVTHDSSDFKTDRKGTFHALRKLKFSEKQRPIIAQIWGSDPEKMYKAAKLVEKLGFDGIDINMGCPDKAVVKSGLGCALSDNPDRAKEMIDAVKRGAKKIPVSVKTRLGNKKNIAETWTPFLLEQKLAALTVHGRIGKQMSTGDADWEAIGRVVQLKNEISPETVIIGNGDVKSCEQGVSLSKQYDVDGVMIARGIFQDPWVFSPEIKDHTRDEYMNLLVKHLDLFEQTFGTTRNFALMKKFFKMYIKEFPGASEFRAKLMECRNYNEVRKLL